MDNFSDNFDYILQLTKSLSLQCWNNRQETSKIEQLLKRLAKQSLIPYEQYIAEPTPEARKEYEKLSELTEEERLVTENYKLIYHIQQQEYLNTKLWTLITQINELLISIRTFIVEQKSVRPENESEFLQNNVISSTSKVADNRQALLLAKEHSKETLNLLLAELKVTCSEIDWERIPRESREFERLRSRLTKIEKMHNITLVPNI
ncbi:HDR138Wp [Eremothecium sinecaudum]|uniref:HDR138Wp n=1 Tax=Eremothecium sinecaudum TaxID=45286 RepID=A0A120K297_9SACH|nr:HDR138Wp [Eremothecium sinecaudum]AMD20880.1 HDR138Wp [Eremothecium sinecaudum]